MLAAVAAGTVAMALPLRFFFWRLRMLAAVSVGTVAMALPLRCAASLRLAGEDLLHYSVSDQPSWRSQTAWISRGASASQRLAAHRSGRAIAPVLSCS